MESKLKQVFPDSTISTRRWRKFQELTVLVHGKRLTVRNCYALSSATSTGSVGPLVAACNAYACVMLKSVQAVSTAVGIAQQVRLQCSIAKDGHKDPHWLSDQCARGILDKAMEDDADSDLIIAAGDFQATQKAVTKIA